MIQLQTVDRGRVGGRPRRGGEQESRVSVSMEAEGGELAEEERVETGEVE